KTPKPQNPKTPKPRTQLAESERPELIAQLTFAISHVNPDRAMLITLKLSEIDQGMEISGWEVPKREDSLTDTLAQLSIQQPISHEEEKVAVPAAKSVEEEERKAVAVPEVKAEKKSKRPKKDFVVNISHCRSEIDLMHIILENNGWKVDFLPANE
ncbi:MAG: hypothetical protein P4M11_00215, partial [Candidatus Pacebacteria bacterium]|nr:hypothetical protein [Candidatus Paceibacterota bacterium]